VIRALVAAAVAVVVVVVVVAAAAATSRSAPRVRQRAVSRSIELMKKCNHRTDSEARIISTVM